MASAETFAAMTRMTKSVATDMCDGRLVLVHEGGYSETHAPFCGHAAIAELTASSITAPDPLGAAIDARQPDARFDAFLDAWLSDMTAT